MTTNPQTPTPSDQAPQVASPSRPEANLSAQTTGLVTPSQIPATEPDIPTGFTKMTPLQMNNATFNSRRTVITPALLEQMAASAPST